MSTTKTFLIFGCHTAELLEAANNQVSKFFSIRKSEAMPFSFEKDKKPDALLYCHVSKYVTYLGRAYYITTMSGKIVCSFNFRE